MPVQGSTSIERMCQLAQVSRAGFYRFLQDKTPVEEDMELRSAIQQIVLEHRRRYGYRRVSAELRRRGMLANHKRVARIMREDNLLAVQPQQFVVTTDSHHELEVCLNLAYRMKLTGIDQLWVADITYVRLRADFVYLAVILDGFSRKVVGWALERTLTSRLAIAALREAIVKRQPRPGLIHHSDRGVQYASGDYVAILEQHQMMASMSRPANPYDRSSNRNRQISRIRLSEKGHEVAHGKLVVRAVSRTSPSWSCRSSSGYRLVPTPFRLCLAPSHWRSRLRACCSTAR